MRACARECKVRTTAILCARGYERKNQGICLCGLAFCTQSMGRSGFCVIKTSRKASWLLVSVSSMNWMLGSIEFRW